MADIVIKRHRGRVILTGLTETGKHYLFETRETVFPPLYSVEVDGESFEQADVEKMVADGITVEE